MLELRSLESGYGRGKTVLRGIDLSVTAGHVVLLMGHNGAGKTTLLRTIFGELEPTHGSMTYLGEPLRGSSPERVRHGISCMAGGRAVFAGLTVDENLRIAATVVASDAPKAAARRELVLEMFPDLPSRLGQVAGNLSGGQQRMLAVSMAVIQEPRLLLLDEPSLGLSPLMVERLYESITAICRRLGTTVLVVEQTINPLILAADEVYILRMGQVVFHGDAHALEQGEHLWNLL
jgi:branched-chain amino acid transport system ATP-binding protein